MWSSLIWSDRRTIYLSTIGRITTMQNDKLSTIPPIIVFCRVNGLSIIEDSFELTENFCACFRILNKAGVIYISPAKINSKDDKHLWIPFLFLRKLQFISSVNEKRHLSILWSNKILFNQSFYCFAYFLSIIVVFLYVITDHRCLEMNLLNGNYIILSWRVDFSTIEDKKIEEMSL